MVSRVAAEEPCLGPQAIEPRQRRKTLATAASRGWTFVADEPRGGERIFRRPAARSGNQRVPRPVAEALFFRR
jgi:hypothetical protein